MSHGHILLVIDGHLVALANYWDHLTEFDESAFFPSGSVTGVQSTRLSWRGQTQYLVSKRSNMHANVQQLASGRELALTLGNPKPVPTNGLCSDATLDCPVQAEHRLGFPDLYFIRKAMGY